MTKKLSTQLKLHDQSRPETQRPRFKKSVAVAQLLRTFEQTTGWQLSPVGGHLDDAESLLITPISANPVLSRGPALALASALSGVLQELQKTQHALWQREAELAAGVPIAARSNEKQHLAQRLEQVLQSGTEAVGCVAAGLYLLDDATANLKLRASYGLPEERLLDSARPLQGSVGDLEALVGHAVVIEDTSLLPHWRVPEKFPAAICVPVSTSSTPLGTLWLFADSIRDFTDAQTNLVEIIAGRIASDLEREMLVSEGVKSKKARTQIAAASTWQQQRLPSISPMLEGWQLAGWTTQSDHLGGDFYDWSIDPQGYLALAVGDAHGSLLQAGLTSAVAQAALKSHSGYGQSPRRVLERLNETLWTGSTGDEFTSLFFGRVDLAANKIQGALAGSTAVLLIGEGGHELLTTDALPLGALPETVFTQWERAIRPGEVMLAMSEGVREARDRAGKRIGESAIATLIRRATLLSANDLAARIRELLDDHCPLRAGLDRTVLVLKRRR